MILIGQYDSPFVRRVGIALTLYGLPFEHRPWSTFGDAEKIRPYNPLIRVPTLVLDDGEVLIESHIILDYLDSLVPPTARCSRPPSRPGTGAEGRRPGHGAGRQGGQPVLREAAAHRGFGRLVNRRRAQICGVARRARGRPRRPAGRLLVRRAASAMPISPSPRCCASSPRRIPAWSRWRLSGARRACGASRGAAGVPGNPAAVHRAGMTEEALSTATASPR